jgi:uncharacterized membrane protein
LPSKTCGWQKKNRAHESTRVLVDVTNTGKRAGTGSRANVHPRPGQFRHAAGQGTEGLSKKISLQPGETKTVALDITPESLAFYDIT